MIRSDYHIFIKSDLFRYCGKQDCLSFLKAYVTIPGFKYTYWFRRSNYFRTKGKLSIIQYLLARYFLRRYSYKFGIDIPCGTSIDKGFYIGHFSAIVISSMVVIGRNVNISQGVTIGVSSRGSNKGAAIIGDGVYIGPGAKIVGSVRIGNNCAIGANAVVTKDVPDNAVVVGIPATIISYKGAEDYILNKV